MPGQPQMQAGASMLTQQQMAQLQAQNQMTAMLQAQQTQQLQQQKGGMAAQQ